LNSTTNLCIIFVAIIAIVVLAFASVLTGMQNQLAQKDEQIQTLQDQIVNLETDLGTVKKGSWNVVESFGGSSGSTTEYFYVAGTELRITWIAYTGVDASIVFGISVYTEGQSEAYETFTNLDDQGTVFLQNLEKGNYYLDVSEDNADQWSIIVETWIPPN
jgi:predicted PurR-regulated permease PerM